MKRLRAGVVVLVVAQTIFWLLAGWIWWSFRGFMAGGASSPRGTRDAYVAVAFFLVAGITVGAVARFLARPGRKSARLLSWIQFVNAVASFALTLAIDEAWVLVTASAVATLALLYFSERRLTSADGPIARES